MLSNSRREMLLALLGFLLVTAVIVFMEMKTDAWWSGTFADYLDPIIAIGTLLVALLVWLNTKAENWRSSWPKKLHVLYLVKRENGWQTHVRILDAPLTSDADIRSWGQSLGQTGVPGSKDRIPFTGFKIVPGPLDRKNKITHTCLIVFLSDVITGAKDGQIFLFDEHGSAMSEAKNIPDNHPIHHLDSHIPQPSAP